MFDFKNDEVFFKLRQVRKFIQVRPEDRGLLRAGQDLDVVGHPAYLLPTPRQYLSSEHKSDSSTLDTFLMLTLMMIF